MGILTNIRKSLFFTSTDLEEVRAELINQGYKAGYEAGISFQIAQKPTNPLESYNITFVDNDGLKHVWPCIEHKDAIVFPTSSIKETPSDSKLLTAIKALYLAAYWSPDRPVDAIALWDDVRSAANIERGVVPPPLEAELIAIEDSKDTTGSSNEGITEIKKKSKKMKGRRRRQ
jgi:hypothetical protein